MSPALVCVVCFMQAQKAERFIVCVKSELSRLDSVAWCSKESYWNGRILGLAPSSDVIAASLGLGRVSYG